MHIFFYNSATGLSMVGHIESGMTFVETDLRDGTPGWDQGWDHIVCVAGTNPADHTSWLYFLNSTTGAYQTAFIGGDGKLHPAHGGTNAAKGFTTVVPVGSRFYLYRHSDGQAQVGTISETGEVDYGVGWITTPHYTKILLGAKAKANWRALDGLLEGVDFQPDLRFNPLGNTHVGASWSHASGRARLIFYSESTRDYAIYSSSETGGWLQTDAGQTLGDLTHLVDVDTFTYLYRTSDGSSLIADLASGRLTKTDTGSGAAGWTHIYEVPPQMSPADPAARADMLFYRSSDGHLTVGHIDPATGRYVQAGPLDQTVKGFDHVVVSTGLHYGPVPGTIIQTIEP